MRCRNVEPHEKASGELRVARRSVLRAAVPLFVCVLLSTRAAAAECSVIDHSHARWTVILRRYVDAGRVDYAGLQRDGSRLLDDYLAVLSGACAADYQRWTKNEKIAFWINAYNAFAVRLILDHYPITSIRRIGWLPLAAFRQKFIPMAGLKGGVISLDDIENGTLRSAFREPRVHFALVCAARSCPALRSEAYRGADLERQLDEQGRGFLGDAAKNRFEADRRTLYLSPIFKWFRADFEQASGTLVAFIAPYLPAIANGPEPTIEFLDYDWSLNDRTG